ncbi:MAG: hypothetical protein CM1200mP3_08990 [Chloroflexota bacterium]|nr:MAG: hypothetical protein CM1200mP3_08990 [Chloroflexota bacterium]
MTESRLVIAILSAVSLMLALSFVVLLLTYLERKALARIQQRMGPTRVGYRGTLQPLADAVKLITKEDIIPAWSDKEFMDCAGCCFCPRICNLGDNTDCERGGVTESRYGTFLYSCCFSVFFFGLVIGGLGFSK